jgi:hypothetical protein
LAFLIPNGEKNDFFIILSFLLSNKTLVIHCKKIENIMLSVIVISILKILIIKMYNEQNVIYSDTSSDDENYENHENIQKLENNVVAKKYCDYVINGIIPLNHLEKLVDDLSVKEIYGFDKYFLGYYCQKKIYLKRKYGKTQKNKKTQPQSEILPQNFFDLPSIQNLTITL